MKIIRMCDYCKKPMGNSWNTETDIGEIELYVHVRCRDDWGDRQIKELNDREVALHAVRETGGKA